MASPQVSSADLFEGVIRMADDALILSHRISEWASWAPQLEEDMALANIALDLLGQARLLLTYAGEIEGTGRMRTRWRSCGRSASSAACCSWSSRPCITLTG